MDIKDRDLTIIGAGAFLTVLCLLFKWPFVARIVIGLLILVAAMIVALMRLGPDGLTIEEFFGRRFKRSLRPRKFSYRGDQEKGATTAAARGRVFKQPASAPLDPLPSAGMPAAASIQAAVPITRPVSLAWEEVGAYRLVTIWLGVIGIYFVYWLTQGGAEDMSHWLRSMFRRP